MVRSSIAKMRGLVLHILGSSIAKMRGLVFEKLGSSICKLGVKYYKFKVKYLKNGGSSIAFQESSIRKLGIRYRHQLVKYRLRTPGIHILGVKYRKMGGGQVFGILDLLCPTDEKTKSKIKI